MFVTYSITNESIVIALLKAQVSIQLGKVFSSDNGVSVSIMYSYTCTDFYSSIQP